VVAKLTDFIESGTPRWDELTGLADEAGRRAESLGPERLRRFVDLYRATSADLAIAARAFPNDPVVPRLERLVVRSRGLLYDRVGRRAGMADFFRSTYWQLVAARARPMGLAATLLVVPGALGAWWALADPMRVASLMPPEFLWVTEVGSTAQGYGTAELVGFSTYVMTNNIRVTLLAFALGITWGLLTGWVVVQNGLILGGIAGLAIGADNWRLLLAAVAAHGVIELSCIVIGAGTGFSLARSMLRPGHRTRRQALGEEAKAAVLVTVGTIPWLVLAGLVEGFVSRTGTTWLPATTIGLVIGGGFWAMVWLLGSRRTVPA
jgi:uncharacterized membrane protein SpoIIM required for sporulation